MNLVVIPVVTGPEMTEAAIESVLAQDCNAHPFVVDNGSVDCGRLIRSYRGRISSITHIVSHSLTSVWNEALDMAFNSLKLDHAMVINNDVVLRPDAYSLMLADGGGFVTGVGVSEEKDLGNLDPSSRSPHPSFSCFLIRRWVWEKVGKFDERYWAWCNDADMHLRMDGMGIDAYSIAVPFLHLGGGSSTIKSVGPKMHLELCQKADADRAEFKRNWGFAVGSDEYYAAFRHARDKKYQTAGVL